MVITGTKPISRSVSRIRYLVDGHPLGKVIIDVVEGGAGAALPEIL